MHKQIEQSSVNPASALGTNQSGMRAANEKLVLTLLRRHGPLAKAEIAKRTGLSAQTVSVIMRGLEAEGLLLRGAPQRGKIGQPSVPMSLNPDGVHFLGLSIGRRSVELILTDFLGNILARRRRRYLFPTADGVIGFVQMTTTAFGREIAGFDLTKIGGMGVAMPFGLWNWAGVIGVDPKLMAHWRHRDIATELGALLPFPIFVRNDASAACGAELAFGMQALPTSFLYFYVGYFIGGGVVLENRLYTGPSGSAGGLGPMLIRDGCGGQVQLIEKSSIAILDKALIKSGLDTDFLWQDLREWPLPALIEADWIKTCALGLAQAIVAACCVIDFEAIVIDGWMPEGLRAKIVTATQTAFEGEYRTGILDPMIIPGSQGARARALGAASLPIFDGYMMI